MPDSADDKPQPDRTLSTTTPAADQSAMIRRSGLSAVILSAITALAAVTWALVIWPVQMGSDPGETIDAAPSSPAAATLYVALVTAVVLTVTAALGWWRRTRSKVILAVLWLALGVMLFGAAAVVMFVLPFL
jgi:hypothetical protein